MSDAIFCPNCGERISSRAKFCSECGARVEDYRVEAEPPPPAADREPVTERVGRVDPQAGELLERLAMPGIVAAAIVSLTAAGIVLLAGLLIAIITPDASILGLAGADVGLITETFRQAVGTLLTAIVDFGLLLGGARRIHPLVLAAVPIGAIAFMTRRQLHRTEGAAPMARLGWAMLAAIPFALLMLIFAVAGGDSVDTQISPSAGGAFALGLLWGVIGALIGAASLIPAPSERLRPTVTAATATLRPLAAILVVCTVIGLVGWLIQVAADAGEVRTGRSAPTALVEEAAFAGEHGVHLTALAAGALFRADGSGALGLPFPVDDPNDVPGPDGGFRIFSYNDVLPAAVVAPSLIVLIALLSLGALYAGFAAARAVRAGSLVSAAAWGAITGPSWALAMTVLGTLAGGVNHGDADDASVFGIFLLGGALLGAAGGALAVSAPVPSPADPPDPAGTPASPAPSAPGPESRSRP